MSDDSKNLLKATLNLPTTDFPMRASLATKEPEILALWDRLDIYQNLRTFRAGAPRYTLHDGPPYANGPIHIGHALNKVLKDFVIRSQGMLGKDAAYVPGWDCHGLPIELNVEKTLQGRKLSPDAFRQACRDHASIQLDRQKESFVRLGVLGDFDHPYTTMDQSFEAAVVKTLADFIDKQLLFSAFKPVHWCLECGSSLAEAEVEYKDKTSTSIDVAFNLVDPKPWLKAFNQASLQAPVAVVIWTTTPWTLPGNQAVAMGSAIEYALVRSSKHDACYVIASTLVEACEKRWETSLEVLGTVAAGQLPAASAHHPYESREVPVAFGSHVSESSGTGLVHCAGAHGDEDYQFLQTLNLAPRRTVDSKGVFLPETELVGGKPLREVGELILSKLQSSGQLLASAPHEHSYPHCWRHKTPLTMQATRQFFIRLSGEALDRQTLKAVGQSVNWITPDGKQKMQAVLKNRPDWCISRQRLWGSPLALVVHKHTAKLHPEASQIARKAAELIEKDGLEAWYEAPLSNLVSDLENPPIDEYEKVLDVVDVWLDSGVTHQAVLGTREELDPVADLYLEGKDQYRGWFQSSLWTSMLINGAPPYKAVLTNGFVVDKHGHKMSKSLGNVTSPEDVTSTLGADVLRIWAAQSDYTHDVVISDATLKQASDIYRRFRNTLRFLLSALSQFDLDKDLVSYDQLLFLDRSLLSSLYQLQTDVQAHYQAYQFGQVLQKTHIFCAQTLGGLYLDIIKDRQYTLPLEHPARKALQTTCYHTLRSLLTLLHPILPFTTEEAYQYLQKDKEEGSICLDTFYQHKDIHPLDPKYQNMADLLFGKEGNLREMALKSLEQARDNGVIKSNAEALLEFRLPHNIFTALFAAEIELPAFFMTAEVNLITSKQDLVPQVKVVPSEFEKCERCWRYTPNSEPRSAYQGEKVCQRCLSNLDTKTSQWENRQYF